MGVPLHKVWKPLHLLVGFKFGFSLKLRELSALQYVHVYTKIRGTRWRSLLRHCATSRKVAGSIPDGVTGIFH